LKPLAETAHVNVITLLASTTASSHAGLTMNDVLMSVEF
jgi:hypothetical protein